MNRTRSSWRLLENLRIHVPVEMVVLLFAWRGHYSGVRDACGVHAGLKHQRMREPTHTHTRTSVISAHTMTFSRYDGIKRELNDITTQKCWFEFPFNENLQRQCITWPAAGAVSALLKHVALQTHTQKLVLHEGKQTRHLKLSIKLSLMFEQPVLMGRTRESRITAAPSRLKAPDSVLDLCPWHEKNWTKMCVVCWHPNKTISTAWIYYSM